MTELSSEAQTKLKELRQEYLLSLPDKTEQLIDCWEKNGLNELYIQCHKIAGSSASFELPDISFAAQTLEKLCKTRLENNQTSKFILKNDLTLVNAYTVLLEILSRHENIE